MNCIRIGTDSSITVHEWPGDNKYRTVHPFLTGLIGNECDIVEHVYPNRLYKKYGGPVEAVDPCEKKGMASMLIDEEGRCKPNRINLIGSWLYGTDMHGCPIFGNIIIVGEYFDDEACGVNFCGLEPEVEEAVLKELKELAAKLEGGESE